MVQTALPSGTVSNDWNVTGASAHVALQVADGDTTKIDSSTSGDLARVNIDSLTDPVSSVDHVIRINAQATGSGQPERLIVRLFEGCTQRAASSTIAITRSSYNDFSYTLCATEINSISDYTDLRIEIENSNASGSEVLDVTYAAFEIPDAPVGEFAHSQGCVIG